MSKKENVSCDNGFGIFDVSVTMSFQFTGHESAIPEVISYLRRELCDMADDVCVDDISIIKQEEDND